MLRSYIPLGSSGEKEELCSTHLWACLQICTSHNTAHALMMRHLERVNCICRDLEFAPIICHAYSYAASYPGSLMRGQSSPTPFIIEPGYEATQTSRERVNFVLDNLLSLMACLLSMSACCSSPSSV